MTAKTVIRLPVLTDDTSTTLPDPPDVVTCALGLIEAASKVVRAVHLGEYDAGVGQVELAIAMDHYRQFLTDHLDKSG